jgi:glycosyltransferase involved in cell wall biosynthesis
MDQKKILVIIPAYNESKSIGSVIDDVRKYLSSADIAVVNDGSLDETGGIAEGKGVFVLNLPYNLGIGGAVQTGYKFAAEREYEVAVQVDADGQHPPQAIPGLIEAVHNDEADMVIGSRYIENEDREPSLTRSLGKSLLSGVVSFLAGQTITDSSSGFRAMNRRVIHLLASRYPRDYPEPESVILLVREKFRVKEIPVRMNRRMAGKSSITLSKGLYYVIKVIVATVIDMFEKRIFPEEPES